MTYKEMFPFEATKEMFPFEATKETDSITNNERMRA